ncbi:CAMK/CDPK protein kinase [Plasmodium inui San Antonio 1]|uniref:non-specific serine/threonine protein kinase n=1 Tax=Plasmodium inui San Antonio 1 TaxID=1237626 RepID=W7A167_9APIC|nr:CAMK/CDPK protein kinase [Plasmodium inui San Antonio 1]EUD65415.1 CAMK/CDPK protein kinase [Plasmodium inui San Antonio 1]
MILDVIKNNFEKKGEPFYSNKMRTRIEKEKKQKKKKKKENLFSLQDEIEKDSTKVESADDVNSLTESEAHSKSEPPSGGKEDSPLQIAKGRNAPLKTMTTKTATTAMTTTMTKKKKKKNSSKGLYLNVKRKNTHYGENEQEDFAENIFENENFDELQFVEEEHMEYRTYNSFSNSALKLISKYSVDDGNGEITKKKGKKKRQGQERQEQEEQESYKKYNFNHEEPFKGNHNEFDSDIIKFLNRNKKSIDYDKGNVRPFQKGDAYSYDATQGYGGKRGKHKQLHAAREDKDNYEHYRAENATYYDREEEEDEEEGEEEEGDQSGDDQIGGSQSGDDQSGGSQSDDDQSGDDYNTNAAQYNYERNGGVDRSGKFKRGASLGEEEEEGEEEDEEEEDEENDGGESDESDCDPLDRKEETRTEDPSRRRPPLASKFQYRNTPAEGHIYDKREDSHFENEENTWKATEHDPTAGIYGGEKRHEIEFGNRGWRKEEKPKVEHPEKTENKKYVNINVRESNLKKSSMSYGRKYNMRKSAMEGRSSLRNALNIGKPNLSKDKYKFNLPNGEDKLIKFNIGAHTISKSNNNSRSIHRDERITAFDYMLHSSNQSVHAGTNDYFLKRGGKEEEVAEDEAEEDCTDSHFGQAGKILQPLREETQKDPHGEEKKKHNIKSFLDKIKHRKNNEDMLKREHSKYDHAERSDKKDKFKMKFTDILHGRTLGNFFHRNKSSAAKSLSPQRERDSSVEPCIKSNGVEKFGWLHLGSSDPRRDDQQQNRGDNQQKNKGINQQHHQRDDHFLLHQKTSLSQPSMIKDDMAHYSKRDAVKILDTFSNQEEAINDGTIMHSGRRPYDNRGIHKSGSNNMPGFSYKGGSSPKAPIPSKVSDSPKVAPVTWDGTKNDIGKTLDRNKKNPKPEDSKAISSNDIMSGKYSRKYHTSRHDLDADTNRKVPGKESILPSIYQQLHYRSPLGNENKIAQFEDDPLKRGRQIALQGGKGKDEESDVRMEQTLNRKMIENNELKKRNENNDEVLATPFYIKSKIDKVLKNSEIFERSARATFQQFDVKNKNFLHFSEIDSLIQKLCFNLELPPVDKNILSIVYKDYDSSKNNSMNYTDFRQMYWDLLKQIKKKYYPTKNLKIKRNCIISRKNLGGYDYSSIYNYLSFKKILGCGAFGEVHLVEDNICKLYKVVKILKKKKLKNIKINEEINVLIYLDHPNIIKIFDVYENVDCTYIVMELCEGGELMEKIVKSAFFNEEYIKNIMFQILCAIAYMHSNNIAHKDLKPENILFKSKGDDTLKIIDFGLAELINHTEGVSKTAAGTLLYMAPEVFKKKFTIKCDIWSAGVIMFFLFSKNFPFCGNTYDEIKLSIFKDEPDYKSLKGRMSQPALHILKLMLEKDHTRRPMAAVLLHHPWFQGFLDPVEINPSTLSNIKAYMKQSNIRNIIVNIMAHELSVIDSHLKYINELFCKIDTNHNGSLSHGEIYAVLANAGIKKWDINRIVQALDINDRGSVTYTEFIAGCYRWKDIESTFLKAAFNKIDKDEDGYISKSDIVTLVQDKVIESHDVDNFFTSVFLVKKGLSCERRANRINFEDFKEYLLSTF